LSFRSLFALFSSDLAIDLGTANTCVYARGRGVVVNEPSIVAINKISGRIEAVGREAKEMLGRTPGNIVAIKPMKDGVIADFEVTEKMLAHFIKKAHNRTMWVRPRIVIGVPSEITQVEKRAVKDSAYRAKASEVYLVEEAMAAAIGAGMPIEEASGNMVVDIGGGTTDIAVISLAGIVYSKAIRVAGNEMDEAIIQYIKKTYNLLIGERVDEFDLARLDPNNLPEGWDEAQPSHPELLEELATYFRENAYSLNKLFKVIANSSAYQLSARFPEGKWTDAYTKYYARKYVRMLSAEEVHDAITVATGIPGKVPDGGEAVPMAMQASLARLKGDLKSFMQAFGHSNRTTVARPPIASPLQPIMMMQSPVVVDRVVAKEGSRVQEALVKHSDGEVVDELFTAALGREPSPSEKDVALTALAKDRVEGAQNLQWALMNTAEFLYNF
jgi:hypothetical protein